MLRLPTYDHVMEARDRIVSSVHRTPLYSSRTLSGWLGRPVLLKCENLQKTGSFKVRGLLNHVLLLPDDVRSRGVITISAGNAAQAVAWAAASAGAPCTVVMPASANPTKVEASRGYGAEVILHGTAREAFELAYELAEERGLRFVHPFDDADVVAGHASVALEIAEDLPDVRDIVVPLGGGGLASGISLGAAAVMPDATVWFVEPEGAPAMSRSFEAGYAVHLDRVETIADGLAPPMAGEVTFAVLKEHDARPVLVSDDEIRVAMRVLFERAKMVVEPSGAAGLAALLASRIDGAGPCVVVLSGGNVDLDRLGELFAERTVFPARS